MSQDKCYSKNRDLDCSPTNHKNRDSSASVRGSLSERTSEQKPYSRIAAALAQYMNIPGEECVEPTDRHVADVLYVAWAHGRSERHILIALKYLYEVRGLRPGTRNGPRHYAWFKTVIADMFTQEDERRERANPTGFTDWNERNETKAAKLADECF